MSDHTTTAAKSPPAEPTQLVNGVEQPTKPEKATDQQVVSVVGEAEQAEIMKRAKHYKKWNRRLKIFFCCLGYKKNKVSYFTLLLAHLI